MTCGLTASTSTSHSRASSPLSLLVRMPAWRARSASCCSLRSLAMIREASTPCCSRPPIRLEAMLPAPMNPMVGAVMSVILRGGGVIAGPEQGGADAYQGSASGNGFVEVIAHAHGQGIQRQCQLGHGLAQGTQRYTTFGTGRGRGGNGHQATQAQPGQLRHRPGQGRQLVGADAGLAVLAADVHLQAYV